MNTEPDAGGHFGVYGGRYVPEVLMSPLEELEIAYREARQDAAFQSELNELLRTYAGRPTPLYYARRPSAPRAAPPSRGAARASPLFQARRSAAHRGAQDQQRARPGAARAPH